MPASDGAALALTLVDVLRDPSSLDDATPEQIVDMLGTLRCLEARLWARVPSGRGAVPTITREYLTLEDLRDYSGISVRKLRDFVTDPVHPSPHHRADGKVRVRRSDFDAWMARHRRVGREDLTALVNEVMRGLTGAQTT